MASATRDGHRMFMTVLNSQDRDTDAAALLDWAWQVRRSVPIITNADQTLRLAHRLGIGDNLLRMLAVCP